MFAREAKGWFSFREFFCECYFNFELVLLGFVYLIGFRNLVGVVGVKVFFLLCYEGLIRYK